MNFEQLKTIFWLRWRLSRNQWARSRGIGPILAVIVTISWSLLAGASFAGGLAAGVFALREVSAETVQWVWFGLTVVFIFMWLFGLVSELQRSETIDLQRLMHLPVALGQMFSFNYVASHLTFSIILVVPLILGLSLGLTVARGPAMLLLAPLALSMVFMISAWTYCLRGWLAAMMTNPRRRRAIIMGMTLCFVLLGQAPNLYFNVLRRFQNSSGTAAGSRTASTRQDQKRKLDQLMAAQKFVPPLWVPLGAGALANGNALPALGALLGCAAIGAMGLRRAYRTTLRFYYGETGGNAPSSAKWSPDSGPAKKISTRLLELKLPGVPEQASAVATATFRSFLRAPEVKMAWATSFIVTLIAGASILLSSSAKVPPAARPFVVVGPMGFSLLMLLQFLTNQFGFDREGFRALVLSPADRSLILLGKNLALLPIALSSGALLLGLTAIWLRLPLVGVAAGLFQLMTLLLLGAFGSNLLSILVPYRIQSGSIKPTKMPGLAMLLMVLCQLLFPLVMLPVLVPPLVELLWQLADLPPAMPVNLVLSMILALSLAFLYWITLEPMGRLLHRREITILGKVTQEVE